MEVNRRNLILTSSAKSGLPKGYTPVAYVGKDASNGVAVDTGIFASSDITVEGKVLFGATGVFPVLTGKTLSSPSSGIIVMIANKNLNIMSGTTATYKYSGYDPSNPSTFKLDNKEFVYNGEVVYQQEPTDFSTNIAMRLFVSHLYYSGADDYKEDYGYGDITDKGIRVYWLKIYKKGILVRNFVPCVNENGEACLYDLVTQRPFYNYLDNPMLYGMEEN